MSKLCENQQNNTIQSVVPLIDNLSIIDQDSKDKIFYARNKNTFIEAQTLLRLFKKKKI